MYSKNPITNKLESYARLSDLNEPLKDISALKSKSQEIDEAKEAADEARETAVSAASDASEAKEAAGANTALIEKITKHLIKATYRVAEPEML